ncbi:MAG: MerR family transcriptional regulator [Spirochaetales bacterium]
MSERTVVTEGELAERVDIDTATLRAWIDAGVIQPEGKSSNGVAFFDEAITERVEQVKNLFAIGYAAEEVAKIVKKVGLPQEGRSASARSAGENLLTVGALAESVGVSPRTIKHWEDKGIIEADARSEGGFRLFKEHYIYLCHLIQDLQLFGYSLDQIQQVAGYFRDFIAMRESLEGFPPGAAAAELTEMLAQIDGLFARTAQLKNGIERWEKLLNKHKRLIVDLKKANEKRLEASP